MTDNDVFAFGASAQRFMSEGQVVTHIVDHFTPDGRKVSGVVDFIISFWMLFLEFLKKWEILFSELNFIETEDF